VRLSLDTSNALSMCCILVLAVNELRYKTLSSIVFYSNKHEVESCRIWRNVQHYTYISSRRSHFFMTIFSESIINANTEMTKLNLPCSVCQIIDCETCFLHAMVRNADGRIKLKHLLVATKSKNAATESSFINKKPVNVRWKTVGQHIR